MRRIRKRSFDRDQLVERKSERGDIADNIPRTLFKSDENAGLVKVARAVDQERRREKRLAATGWPQTSVGRAVGTPPSVRSSKPVMPVGDFEMPWGEDIMRSTDSDRQTHGDLFYCRGPA